MLTKLVDGTLERKKRGERNSDGRVLLIFVGQKRNRGRIRSGWKIKREYMAIIMGTIIIH